MTIGNYSGKPNIDQRRFNEKAEEMLRELQAKEAAASVKIAQAAAIDRERAEARQREIAAEAERDAIRNQVRDWEVFDLTEVVKWTDAQNANWAEHLAKVAAEQVEADRRRSSPEARERQRRAAGYACGVC